uniref:Transcriptional regulator n=1 Tax=Dulem virus 35 TaxID=3145753 RepID=A0AAU8AYV3_9CAUD
MKTRQTSYVDYGFVEGNIKKKKESNRLKEYCRKPDFNDHITLMHAAVSANESLAGDIFYSIINNLSYEDISRIKYIPISKTDFYGYQRKCLAQFRDLLIMYGKWK